MKTLLLAILLANPLAARAADLTIDNAFSRASPASSPGVAYLTIHGGSTPDRLLSITSPRAPKVEMHTMTMQGEVMRMRETETLDIPANAIVKLAPGGLHLMLVGLASPLKPGETLPLTLTFEKAGPKTIAVPVGAPGATGPARATPGAEKHVH